MIRLTLILGLCWFSFSLFLALLPSPCYTDGAGLLCGVLKTLLSRGPECPKVLAATHFHEIFRDDLLDPDHTPITFLHMEIMFSSDDGEVLPAEDGGDVKERIAKGREKILYLYRCDVFRFASNPFHSQILRDPAG